jgi:small redox-active disulfide protein 2
MSSDTVQIRVGDRTIGVVGLKRVMADLAGNASGRTDDECREFLYRGIAGRNYIPANMEKDYKDALLRAFRAFSGEAAEEVSSGGVRIQVLGPGCHNCAQLEQDVREVLAELGVPGELSHVTDPAEIAKYGLMGVPALVINGRVVCVGTLPHRNRIRQWIIDLRASMECKEST